MADIHVITYSEDVDVEQAIEWSEKFRSVQPNTGRGATVLEFPEITNNGKRAYPVTDSVLMREIHNEIDQAIKEDRPLYILTQSVTVLMGVRVALYHTGVQAIYHQLSTFNNPGATAVDHTGCITAEGRIENEELHVLDSYDRALDVLCDLLDKQYLYEYKEW